MSAPFVAMAAAVDVTQDGDRIEARDRQTRQVLGTGTRCYEAGRTIGWLIMCGNHREMTATVTTARFALLNAASAGLR